MTCFIHKQARFIFKSTYQHTEISSHGFVWENYDNKQTIVIIVTSYIFVAPAAPLSTFPIIHSGLT